jgi:hypothetical protein
MLLGCWSGSSPNVIESLAAVAKPKDKMLAIVTDVFI